MPTELKNQISHRAKALKKMKEVLIQHIPNIENREIQSEDFDSK